MLGVTSQPIAISTGQSTNTLAIGTTVFPVAQNVLAEFNFDDNVLDTSGQERHATLISGSYTTTVCGKGLVVGASQENGFQWSQYAGLLTHPYTVEIILTPKETSNWNKLFSFDDQRDNGWYYKNEGLQAYPNPVLGGGQVLANQQHYLAFVSTSESTIDIYFQGQLLGNSKASFTAPPTEAIFFKDDSAVRGEDLAATVEAVRISSTSRTVAEIAAVQLNLQRCGKSITFLPFTFQ
jgi:hypothetical protein